MDKTHSLALSQSISQSKQSGFSLIELLVVLVLFSLISTLFFQGLSYINRVSAQQRHLSQTYQKDHVQYYWLEQLIAGIMAQHSKDQGHLKGSSTTLEGMSFYALEQQPGEPTAFQLSLETHAEAITLYYQATQQPKAKPWPLLHWSEQHAPYLSYQDRNGQWHEQWPPENQQQPIPLPQMICLCSDHASSLFFPIKTRPVAPSDLRDYEGL